MLTLKKRAGVPDFGLIAGDYRLKPKEPGAAHLSSSAVGNAVKQVMRSFFDEEPNIRLLQYALMPDHLHLLLFVQATTAEILGRIVARFKVAVNTTCGIEQVFETGFNDQILKPSRTLTTLYEYLQDNPRRLAVRIARPDYFCRVNNLNINGKSCQAYGNFQLLANPFKAQVVVHRADTPQERKRNAEEWIYTVANGGVLVSPFISPAEKEIRALAEELDGKIILIKSGIMPQRWKPAAHDFELCEAGKLLIIFNPGKVTGESLSRNDCLQMNSLAQTIVNQ